MVCMGESDLFFWGIGAYWSFQHFCHGGKTKEITAP